MIMSDDEFATYDDIMQDLDDRDDTNDRPTESYYDGDHCEHGVYVGGCGIDWMCEWCESGISAAEAKRIITAERTRATREKANRAAEFLNVLLTHHGTEAGGIWIAHMVQESSRVMNPLSRYGRH